MAVIVRADFGDNSRSFSNFIKALKSLLDDVLLKFREEGIEFLALDPSRVVLVSLKLPVTVFKEYEVEEEVNVGVRVPSLAKFIGRLKGSESLILEYDDNKIINIVLEGKSKRKFRMLPVEVDETELEIPELPYEFSFEIGVKDFEEIIEDAMLIDEVLKIVVDKYAVVFKSIGVKDFEAKLNGNDGGVSIEQIEEQASESKSQFGIKYLKDVVKVLKVSENTRLMIGNEMPLYAKSKIGDGSVEILLAPRYDEGV